MRLDDPIQPVIIRAADLVAQASTGYLAGATKLEATDLAGDDWHDRWGAGVKELSVSWRPADQALKDARTAVVALGSADPRAVTALAKIDNAIAFVGHGYDYVTRVFWDLPSPLTQPFAKMAVGRIGGAGRTMSHALEQASASIRALAAAA